MKGVTARLNVYLRDFPAYDSLHPFEKSLLDLSVGVENYARIVNNVDKLRKSVIKVCLARFRPVKRTRLSACRFSRRLACKPGLLHSMPPGNMGAHTYVRAQHCSGLQVGKTYAAKASRTQSVESAEAAQAEGARALEKVLTDQGKGVMWEVQNLSRSLRRVPQIDLYVPTVRLSHVPRPLCVRQGLPCTFAGSFTFTCSCRSSCARRVTCPRSADRAHRCAKRRQVVAGHSAVQWHP